MCDILLFVKKENHTTTFFATTSPPRHGGLFFQAGSDAELPGNPASPQPAPAPP
jgi:hypothetical protein